MEALEATEAVLGHGKLGHILEELAEVGGDVVRDVGLQAVLLPQHVQYNLPAGAQSRISLLFYLT